MSKAVRSIALVSALLLVSLGAARADYRPPSRYPGTFSHIIQQEPIGTYDYWMYTPSSYDEATPAPLLVVIHGCNTTAVEQINANVHEPVAEREGFVVLYPDFRNEGDSNPDSGESDDDSQVGGHPVRCWRFYNAGDSQRGVGDPAAIANMTRAVMAKRNIDPNRVYVIGMSSGAMMTGVLGATYPDLYAAIGVVAGCAYLDAALCIARRMVDPDTARAQGEAAAAAMGSHKRVVPILDIQGTMDGTVPLQSSFMVMKQWITTANIVKTGSPSGPFPLTPTSHVKSKRPGGYKYTTDDYRDSRGCLIGRHVYIHGMDHFWPGGSTDKKWAEWTDAKAPSGAEVSWDFFSHFTKTSTGGACTEVEGD